MENKKNNTRLVPFGDENNSQTLKSLFTTNYNQGTLLDFFISNSLYILSEKLFAIFRKVFRINDRPDLSSIHKDLIVNIVDVGAADGFHKRWYNLGSAMKVNCFEPEEKAFLAIEEKYRNDDRVTVHQTALSSKKEQLTLYLTAWMRAAGVYNPAKFTEHMYMKNLYEVKEEVKLEALPLSDICSTFDFIKIDTQGHELPILEGSRGAISQCIGIEVEVPFNEKIYGGKSPSFAQLHDFCITQGFKMVELRNPDYWHYDLPNRALESKGFISYSDALYFRMPDDIISLVKNKKYTKDKIYTALALYLLYRNYEFAYILNQNAYRENLIRQDVSDRVNNLIEEIAGSNKILSRRVLNNIQGFLSGRGVNGEIGY